MTPRDRIRQTLITKFKATTHKRLEQLNNVLVTLEKQPDNVELVNLAMREIHTLKGEAKLIGFADINLVAHRTEDLMIHARDRQFRMSRELSNLILSGFDTMAQLLDKERHDVNLEAFVNRVDALLEQKAPTSIAPVSEVTHPKEIPTATSATPATPEIDQIPVDIEKLDQLTELVITTHRDLSRASSTVEQLRHRAQEGYLATKQLIETTYLQQVHLLDRDRVEKLVADLTQRIREEHARYQSLLSATNEGHDELLDGRAKLEAIEQAVRDFRLLPLSSIFGRFPRAMRDLAQEQGKQLRLELQGGEFELDKHVLDRISEPLLHLMRNCVDHGLETPTERTAHNKPTEGVITLSARQVGARLEISVSDDGRGISVEKIRNTAQKIAQFKNADFSRFTDQDYYQLLFQPGFSTAEQVTMVSGRGVGLDVVKEKIESLGGSVAVTSRLGQGASFVLNVPVSVVMTTSLVFAIDSRCFAVPADIVQCVATIEAQECVKSGEAVGFRRDNVLIPLNDLSTLIGASSTNAPAEVSHSVLVLQVQEQLVGLRVDEIVGQFDLVQRAIDPFIKGIDLLIGTAVLDDGNLVLFLNSAAIVRQATHSSRTWNTATPAPGRGTIVIVDDSELTRDLIEATLRQMGHTVYEGVNGQEGLELLNRHRADLLITDLEMPMMDGFQLIEEVRKRAEWRDLPIVVVSSLGSDNDKRKASSLGADAYIVKSSLHDGSLQQTVQRFIKS